jgi:hypothetical protein
VCVCVFVCACMCACVCVCLCVLMCGSSAHGGSGVCVCECVCVCMCISLMFSRFFLSLFSLYDVCETTEGRPCVYVCVCECVCIVSEGQAYTTALCTVTGAGVVGHVCSPLNRFLSLFLSLFLCLFLSFFLSFSSCECYDEMSAVGYFQIVCSRLPSNRSC